MFLERSEATVAAPTTSAVTSMIVLPVKRNVMISFASGTILCVRESTIISRLDAKSLPDLKLTLFFPLGVVLAISHSTLAVINL